MGERASGLTAITANRESADGGSPREAARRLAGEIAELREELGGLVAELDRRRHELTDLRLQLRRHARAATIIAVTLVGVAGSLVWLKFGSARGERAMPAQPSGASRALGWMTDHDEPGAIEPGIARKIFVGAATGTLATAMSRLVGAIVSRARARRPTSQPDSGRRAA